MTKSGTSSWWRRTLDKVVVSEADRDDTKLMREALEKGAVTAKECCDRQRVSVHGTLRSVIMQPSEERPRMEARLYDGTGEVALVWLGRRRIKAIEPGRSLTAEGTVLVSDGQRVIFNPRYELDPPVAR